jgi:hypothetical protein
MSARVSRRSLLRGLGYGGVLLAPFVRQFVAQAQGTASDPNLVIFYTPNGFLRSAFGASGTETNFSFLSSTAALEPHKSDVVVFKNINNMCYPGSERSHGCISRVLTCVSGSVSNVAAGPSFDHVMAKALGGTPLLLSALPQRSDFTWHSQLSWAAGGSATRGRADTSAVFDQLFPANENQPVDNTAAKWNARNKSVLDAVRGDIQTLHGRLDQAGKEKLDLHTSSLRELELSIQQSDVPSMACELGALPADVDASLPAVPNGTPRTSKLYTPLLRDHTELQLDLIAHALACGKKRVATLLTQECSWEGVNIDGDNANESHHKISHYASDAITGDGPRQMKAIDSFYAARFAYLVQKLKTLGILGNTICLWVTEIRESHDQGEFVWIAAGGKDLGVKTGRFQNYAYYGPHNDPRTDTRNKTTSDLFVSIQKALGVNSNTFGDAKWCHGGLPEYFSG